MTDVLVPRRIIYQMKTEIKALEARIKKLQDKRSEILRSMTWMKPLKTSRGKKGTPR